MLAFAGASIQFGSFHFVSVVDASSSTSLAAYININSLTYFLEDNSAWFSKSPVWKVRNGGFLYHYLGYFIDNKPHSSFDAFSRVGVRVDVKIPDGVKPFLLVWFLK